MDYDTLFTIIAPHVAEPLFLGLSAVFGTVITWGATQFARTTGIKIQQQRRDQLHNGALTVVKKLLIPILNSNHVPTTSELNAILRSAPELIKHMNPQASAKVTNEQLATIATSKALEVITNYLKK